jgi:N-acetylglucosaminyl-diphospho-decaprenol L-rhamnosyltransferase
MASSASLIVVNYRSASLAVDAIRTARAATRNPLQVVVVDNSVDAKETDALRPHADLLIAPDLNLGYGAAINRARSKCDGETLIVANADVHFGDRAIDLLVDSGADVAGPALYWDDAFRWILPPSDLHTATDALDAAIASRSVRWQRSRDRQRIQRRLDFWSLKQSTPVPAISGAIMAIRRSAFDRIGGFDERFHLYFEEIDFQRRLGGGILYLPEARCRHIYNQSAAASDVASAEYARSELAYLAKWSGSRIARWLKSIERPRAAQSAEPIADDIPIERDGLLVEASPLASFETAAGHHPRGPTVGVPEEVWRAYRSEKLYMRVIEAGSARVVKTYVKDRIAA